jgi:hypothetical protein
LEALRFTVLPPADKPAAEDFLFGEEWVVVGAVMVAMVFQV